MEIEKNSFIYDLIETVSTTSKDRRDSQAYKMATKIIKDHPSTLEIKDENELFESLFSGEERRSRCSYYLNQVSSGSKHSWSDTDSTLLAKIKTVLQEKLKINHSVFGVSPDRKNQLQKILRSIETIEAQHDKTKVLEKFKNGEWNQLSQISPILLEDRNFVLTCIELYPHLLETAKEFNNDPIFVKDAVEKNREALKYASDSCKNDYDVCLKAFRQYGLEKCWPLFGDDIKKNIKLLSLIAEKDGTILIKILNDYKKALDDRDSKRTELKQEEDDYHHENRSYSHDWRIIQKDNVDRIKNDLASSEKRVDEYDKVREKALKQNGLMLEHIHKKFTPEKELCLIAVQQNGLALKFIPSDFQEEHPDIVLEAVKQNGMALKFVDEAFQEKHSEALKQIEAKNTPQPSAPPLEDDIKYPDLH